MRGKETEREGYPREAGQGEGPSSQGRAYAPGRLDVKQKAS